MADNVFGGSRDEDLPRVDGDDVSASGSDVPSQKRRRGKRGIVLMKKVTEARRIGTKIKV